MRVALLQYPIEWANPQVNIGLLNERLRAIAGRVDIAIVPEMFSTGFCTNRPDLAEQWGGPTCQALQRMADEYDMAIAGSLIIRETGKQASELLRNRGFLFRPCDEPCFCDKRHLYRSGGESEFFVPGDQHEVWSYRGAKIRLAVCYDLRFPVWLRQERDNLYDILICVGCWPTIRIQYWDALLPARAAENQSYVVAVNMVGTDGMQLDYNGHSVAYDTRLQEIAGFEDYESGTHIVELSIELLRHYREVLPIWQDADGYQLEHTDTNK